ncbi:MAG: DNA cytosine methyltransferase, partial [Aestuariivirga sp.]
MLTVGSLFTGIGGFDLGLERAGMSIEWQVERDEWCRNRLGELWPTVPCHYDIRSIDWRFIPRVDLVCGGFPCQPFSVAGRRRGTEDDRYLWPEVVRCLETVRPTWFLGENVPGFASMAQFIDEPPVDAEGAALGEIGDVYHRMGRGIANEALATLEGLGYQVIPFAIPACAVDARHIRERIWIVSYCADRSWSSGRIANARSGIEERRAPWKTGGFHSHDAYSDGERKLQSQGHEQEKRERS